MLSIPGFGGIKKILWKDIEPGEIILAGANVNNGPPIELVNYPTLSAGLIFELNQKYHFRPNKEVLVAYPAKGESPTKMGKGFRELEARIKKFNEFRLEFLKKKIQTLHKFKKPLNENFHFLSSDFINKNLNFSKKLNSTKPTISGQFPGFLKKLKLVLKPGDIISGKINKKLFLPDDLGIQLFLGIGYSENFKSEILKPLTEALEYFYDYIDYLFTKTKIDLLGVSEVCDRIKFPLGGREMENGNVCYSTFFKKCMRFKHKDMINKGILISAGSPFDLAESMEMGEKLKNNKIDLSIIYINKELDEDDKKKFLHIAESTNCNLYIIESSEILLQVLLEVWEEYTGNLTVSN
ncbi:MAG: hypothetical protein KDK36_06830, partial [Leptospiraceae bacterium]|nr:hypothetical protein [Leptospiraceae bacterium]